MGRGNESQRAIERASERRWRGGSCRSGLTLCAASLPRRTATPPHRHAATPPPFPFHLCPTSNGVPPPTPRSYLTPLRATCPPTPPSLSTKPSYPPSLPSRATTPRPRATYPSFSPSLFPPPPPLTHPSAILLPNVPLLLRPPFSSNPPSFIPASHLHIIPTPAVHPHLLAHLPPHPVTSTCLVLSIHLPLSHHPSIPRSITSRSHPPLPHHQQWLSSPSGMRSVSAPHYPQPLSLPHPAPSSTTTSSATRTTWTTFRTISHHSRLPHCYMSHAPLSPLHHHRPSHSRSHKPLYPKITHRIISHPLHRSSFLIHVPQRSPSHPLLIHARHHHHHRLLHHYQLTSHHNQPLLSSPIAHGVPSWTSTVRCASA